jgi:hypothetical protein
MFNIIVELTLYTIASIVSFNAMAWVLTLVDNN